MPRINSIGAACIALALPLLACGCATANRPSDAATPAEESLYLLPWNAGLSFTCVQPAGGLFSHKGHQKFALDFDLPRGTTVLAARAGRVIQTKEDSNSGGASRRHAKDGNYVRILHDDRTMATYLHLEYQGVLVEVGEHVIAGAPIGRSGSTGWSAMPHLHFQVDAIDDKTGLWASIPVRFIEIAGDGAPRFLRRYTSENRASPLATLTSPGASGD